jgi:GNAT superfamily N-acetyltransferase
LYRIDLSHYTVKKDDSSAFKYIVMDKDSINDNIIEQIESLEEWVIDKLRADLERDGICIVAMDGDTVAGFNWISINEVYIPMIMKKKVFKPHTAWSEQITVNKNFRGKGLGTSLRTHAFIELKNRKIRKFYGGTLNINEPNIRLSKKAGFEFFIDVHFLRLFGCKMWKYRRVVQ